LVGCTKREADEDKGHSNKTEGGGGKTIKEPTNLVHQARRRGVVTFQTDHTWGGGGPIYAQRGI